MKKQILITIGILILLNSCKQNESKKTEVKTTVESIKVTPENPVVSDSFLVNDSLVFVLASKLEKVALNKKFVVLKKPIKNRHVENLIDTIVTRTFENTKLESYKVPSEEWIYKAIIENSDFELNDFIKVGTKKYVVEKSLAIRIHTDILKIGNIEQTNVFILKFESGNLKIIEFDGYLD